MSEIATFESVIIFAAWFGIMLWIFRPKSKKQYDRYCRIPIEIDENIEIEQKNNAIKSESQIVINSNVFQKTTNE